MKTPINIRQIKIRQITTEVSEGFNYDDTVLFQGSGSVVSVVGKNRQDGSQDVDYLVKCELVDVKKGDVDKVSVVKTPEIKGKSQSQRTRHLAYRIAQEIGDDPEDLYNKSQQEAREWLQRHSEEVKGY